MNKRDQHIIDTTAILVTMVRDAECAEKVPQADRTPTRAVAQYAGELCDLARKAQRCNLDDANGRDGEAVDTEKRRAKIATRVRDIAVFFNCRIEIAAEPMGFPIKIHKEGIPGNSFGDGGKPGTWGISP